MELFKHSANEIANSLSTLLEKEIRVKNFFVGHGIFYKDYMFGVFCNDKIYVRGKEELAEYLKNNGARVWSTVESDKKLDIFNYYSLPENLTRDHTTLKNIILKSIIQIKNEKIAQAISEKKYIRKLPNLSIKYERNLAKIDIHSVDELQKIGAIDSYVELRKNGYLLSINFFWSLVAALKNRLVDTLTIKEKEHYLYLLNSALEKEGLRKVRNSGKFSR